MKLYTKPVYKTYIMKPLRFIKEPSLIKFGEIADNNFFNVYNTILQLI